MQRDDRLERIFSERAKANGFDSVSVGFCPFKEFQVAFGPSKGILEIKVTDYMADAPDGVLSDFADTVFESISKHVPNYSDRYLEWVRSDAFINDKRRMFMERSRNITRSSRGKHRDLAESVDRLLDAGYLYPSDIDNSVFTWTVRPSYRRVGYCSPMMRLVAVSSSLDDPKVPEYVLDYVVYHEALHLRRGYSPKTRSHDSSFIRDEKRFPRYEEANRFLSSMRSDSRH